MVVVKRAMTSLYLHQVAVMTKAVVAVSLHQVVAKRAMTSLYLHQVAAERRWTILMGIRRCAK